MPTPPAITVAQPAIHRAYLAFKADVACADLTDHIPACNQCWSAVHMPGPGRLCLRGNDLAHRYSVAEEETGDGDA